MTSTAQSNALNPDSADWSLICDDRVFSIHSAIVCPRSELFQELVARTSKRVSDYDIEYNDEYDFDADTVARLLHYLYHGHYSFATKYPSRPSREDSWTDWEAEADAAMAAAAALIDEETAIRTGEVTFTDALIAHALVCAAAQDFGLPALSTLAKEKFAAGLDLYDAETSGFDGLVDVVNGFYCASGKYDMDDFKAMLGSACLRDAETLRRDSDLREFIVHGYEYEDPWYGGFGADLLEDALDELLEARKRIADLERKLGAGESLSSNVSVEEDEEEGEEEGDGGGDEEGDGEGDGERDEEGDEERDEEGDEEGDGGGYLRRIE